jgi:hypothetical protein
MAAFAEGARRTGEDFAQGRNPCPAAAFARRKGETGMTSIERTMADGRSERNLSLGERTIYVVAGLGLAALGAKPRPNPLLNVLALAGGAYLAWSGYEGRCAVKSALRELT